MNTSPSSEFANKVALLTGGTAGIGKHLAITLARHGADVFFCGRLPDGGAETLAHCEGRGHYCCCDVADPKAIDAFVDTAKRFNGNIDYVINNVAVDTRIKFAEATIEEFDHFMAVNLRSAFAVTKAALSALRAGSGKSVVNIGTTNYMLGLTPFTVYNASKAGLLGFTRSLARELGPDSIRVNMLSPGGS